MRRAPPTAAFAVAAGGDVAALLARLPTRAGARRARVDQDRDAGGRSRGEGLTAGERTHLRALVGAGLARIEHRMIASPGARGPRVRCSSGAPVVELNPEQAHAVDALVAALPRGFTTVLLHGVTGWGKTEVYLRLIAAARARGQGRAGAGARDRAHAAARGAVPRPLRRRRRGAAQRPRRPASGSTAWRRLRGGEVGIALGARSAVFAPVRDLGVVVVDEEHDGVVQAGGGRPLPRARPGGRARAAGRARVVRARLGHAVAREPAQRAPRAVRAARAARARDAAAAARRWRSSICARTRPARTGCSRRRSPRRSRRRSPPASRRSCSSTAAASRRSCSAAPAATSCAARTARCR